MDQLQILGLKECEEFLEKEIEWILGNNVPLRFQTLMSLLYWIRQLKKEKI